jgi:uncharacterized protein
MNGNRLEAGILPRRAEALVREALADTPVVLIQGARQVGKSTLAARILADVGAPLLTLDSTATFNAARNDPDSFVRQRPGSLMAIDEVQRAPELLRAVKAAVDEDRTPGRFLLTGSANLLTIRGHHESLAGRAETIPLYGLSQGEITGGRDCLADVLLCGQEGRLGELHSDLTRQDYLELICAGSYPEARLRTGRRRQAWFDNYLSRIVDRDARDLSRLAHLDRLPALVRLLAANNAGELVKARIATDAAIPETSLPGYLDLLEVLYVIHTLPAWGGSLTQRMVGRPKVSLLDTGLAARLTNLSPDALTPGGAGAAHAGRLVEAFVAGELRRQRTWTDTPFELFHFRDRNGLEVDVVLEDDSRRVAGIEIKASASVDIRDFRGLTFLRARTGTRFTLGVVLYAGRDAIRFAERLWALPLAALWS